MSEEKRKEDSIFGVLKKFENPDFVLSFLPRKFKNEGGIIIDQNRIVAVYPKQPIPEKMKGIYKKRLGYSVEYIKSILQLFKKQDGVIFHFPDKHYPLLVQGERYLVFLAPQITEDLEEEQDNEI